jgi:hypothetical protein
MRMKKEPPPFARLKEYAAQAGGRRRSIRKSPDFTFSVQLLDMPHAPQIARLRCGSVSNRNLLSCAFLVSSDEHDRLPLRIESNRQSAKRHRAETEALSYWQKTNPFRVSTFGRPSKGPNGAKDTRRTKSSSCTTSGDDEGKTSGLCHKNDKSLFSAILGTRRSLTR